MPNLRCKYRNGKHCRIISNIDQRNPHINDEFCQKTCNPAVDAWKLITFNRLYKLNYQTWPKLVDAANVGKIVWTPTEIGRMGKPCSSCGKVKNIIKGFGRLVWERVTKGKPDDQVVQRAEICAACEHRTFLNVSQWAMNAVQSGDLPINHEPGDWDALWCSICKCCIEAKIRVPEEQCPLGKWPKMPHQ